MNNQEKDDVAGIFFCIGLVIFLICFIGMFHSESATDAMAERMANCKHPNMQRSRTWFDVDANGNKLIEEHCRKCHYRNTRSVGK